MVFRGAGFQLSDNNFRSSEPKIEEPPIFDLRTRRIGRRSGRRSSGKRGSGIFSLEERITSIPHFLGRDTKHTSFPFIGRRNPLVVLCPPFRSPAPKSNYETWTSRSIFHLEDRSEDQDRPPRVPAIFDPIFGSEDRKLGGGVLRSSDQQKEEAKFFDFRIRRSKIGSSSIFGPEDRRTVLFDEPSRFFEETLFASSKNHLASSKNPSSSKRSLLQRNPVYMQDEKRSASLDLASISNSISRCKLFHAKYVRKYGVHYPCKKHISN